MGPMLLEAHASVRKGAGIAAQRIPTVPFSRCRVHFARFSNARKWKGDRSRDLFAISVHCSVENPLKMTSEKTDVIYPTSKKTKFEQLRADHELFLQAFESKFCLRCHVFRLAEMYILSPAFKPTIFPFSEPTQIYRFLRTRNAVAVSWILCPLID